MSELSNYRVKMLRSSIKYLHNGGMMTFNESRCCCKVQATSSQNQTKLVVEVLNNTNGVSSTQSS